MTSIWMLQALEQAESVRGRTAPNPPVGAVLVRDGIVVGAGATQPPGGPHAEVVALRQAGTRSDGATLFVTLEPCRHVGRTPPCTGALIEAGVTKVVVAQRDPNPIVDGVVLRELEAAGITVCVGDGAAAALVQLRPFFSFITRNRPFTTAKWAMTLDGKLATWSGDSRWISGETSRQWVHNLRDAADAIIVGVGTVLADDPQLTVRRATGDGYPRRVERACAPWRVVLDSHCRIPLNSRLLSPALAGRTLICTSQRADKDARRSLEMHGANVAVLPDGARGVGVDFTCVIHELAQQGVMHAIVEGGATVLASSLQSGCVDGVAVFVAPKIIGGAGAPSPVGGIGAEHMRDALALKTMTMRQMGDDVLLEASVAPIPKETDVYRDC